MARFELVSDLHLDFHIDACEILESWEPQTKILIIAGDLCEARNFNVRWVQILKNKWPQIVYVPGNHDYYGRNFIHGALFPAEMHKYCTVLNRERLTIDGIRIAGATLWFPHSNDMSHLEHALSDFNMIGPDYWGVPFRDSVYSEWRESRSYLYWVSADVWVTHHLPFAQSIHPKYAGDPLNPFFYAQCDDLLNSCPHVPKVVVHGHTHEDADYVLNDVHVVCNPMGYPNERGRYMPYAPKLVEFDK